MSKDGFLGGLTDTKIPRTTYEEMGRVASNAFHCPVDVLPKSNATENQVRDRLYWGLMTQLIVARCMGERKYISERERMLYNFEKHASFDAGFDLTAVFDYIGVRGERLVDVKKVGSSAENVTVPGRLNPDVFYVACSTLIEDTKFKVYQAIKGGGTDAPVWSKNPNNGSHFTRLGDFVKVTIV